MGMTDEVITEVVLVSREDGKLWQVRVTTERRLRRWFRWRIARKTFDVYSWPVCESWARESFDEYVEKAKAQRLGWVPVQSFAVSVGA